MKIIDSHMHLGPLGRLFATGYSLDAYLGLMKKLSIEFAVCSDHLSLFGGASAGFDKLRMIFERSGGRVCFLGVFNPHHAREDLRVLKKALKTPGFCGIKIHPTFHGVPAEESAYEPVWEFAAEHSLPMLTHSWSISTHNPAQVLSKPVRFEAYISKYPSVRIIFAHAGGRGEGRNEMIRLVAQFENVYTDYAGDIFDLGLLESLVQSMPTSRILFGSDYPWLDPRANLGRTMLSGIPDDAKERILGLNALELYGFKGGASS